MKRLEIYRCPACGQIMEALENCGCAGISCCGKPMEKMAEQTADTKFEKHVPYGFMQDGELHVKVGETQAHPMMDTHFIAWIEVICEGKICRHYLKPGDVPESVFPVQLHPGMILRAYCNLHGLWVCRV